MTLFELIRKSMKKNIKHYYLYFFALIFSVMLYFVFASLQHDGAVLQQANQSKTFSTVFKIAGILLIVIAGVFIIYANTLFLNRRSREIGVYQLIGLTKRTVARMLIFENLLLSFGALLTGIAGGILVSRLFVMLLVKIMGLDQFVALHISGVAIGQTFIVFAVITCVTSLQMAVVIHRKTLIGLFNAEKTSEQLHQPKRFLSPILALLGIGMIVYGYWLSGHLFNGNFFLNVLYVLGLTIIGAYLIFRMSISWVLYRIRQRKNGFLGLNNSLSIAPLMHRMKGNAKSLTVITVLSAMTLATIAGAYSLYYSTEKDARYSMPYDFMWIDDYKASTNFRQQLEEAQIASTLTELQYVNVAGIYQNFKYTGLSIEDRLGESSFKVFNRSQLVQAGVELATITDQEAIFYDPLDLAASRFVKDDFQIILPNDIEVNINTIGTGGVINGLDLDDAHLVVTDRMFQQLQATQQDHLGAMYAVNLTDRNQLKEASNIFQALSKRIPDSGSYAEVNQDFYTVYTGTMEVNGLLIFIAAFLGFVFLMSTGSILYFKQMTEAEQERKSYVTLTQLGFTIPEMMKGIRRKQAFVFGIPLLIGLLHSIFAIRSADIFFTSDITYPVVIAMGIYVLIYIGFAILTLGYYRRLLRTIS